LAGYGSAAKAAKAIGVSESTYRAHENGQNDINADAAHIYAKAFNVPLAWLLIGEGGDLPSSHADNAENGKSGHSLSIPQFDFKDASETIRIPIIGAVRAGQWLEVDELKSEKPVKFAMGFPDYPVDWQYAFTVEGNSVNKVAKYGDVLICVDLKKSGVRINDGDLVIVERPRSNGQLVERTAKRLRHSAAGIELWPESDDPRFHEPIKVVSQDTDEVRIVAKVMYVVSQP